MKSVTPVAAPQEKYFSVRYLAAFVAVVTFAVYLPALGNDFVSLDDYGYVLDNLHIRRLNGEFFRWAFSDLSAGFWHPLTWLSYGIDFAVWGFNPLGYHLTAIVLHALNTALVLLLVVQLYASIRRTNGSLLLPDRRGTLMVAGVTALLFGLHPLHVESVAWISERKDLVCAFFSLLSLKLYLNYAAGEGPADIASPPVQWFRNRYYLLSLLTFVLALAGKTMAVSLPIVMLILDWYPLGRVGAVTGKLRLLVEKLPYLAASILIAVVSIVAQHGIGAMALMNEKPWPVRILVAFRALVTYLWKMVLPLNLLPSYPYPPQVSLLSAEFALPVFCVVTVAALALYRMKREPYWLAAGGFYLITLLPTLGLVQVGVHSMGDRFTYLPSLAPFLLAGIAVAGLWKKILPVSGRFLLAVTLCLLFSLLSLTTVRQIAVWKDSLRLWNHVIDRGEPFNPLAHQNRGHVYRDLKEYDRAIADYSLALAQEPGRVEYLVSRAVALCEKGELDSALTDLDRAIVINPREYMAFNNRGTVWFRKGNDAKALEDLTRAIALKPTEYLAYQNRGSVYERRGELDNAIADYSRAVVSNPLLAGLYIERGDLYLKKGDMERASGDFLTARDLGDSRRMSSVTNGPVP